MLVLGIASQLMAKPWVQPELKDALANNANSHLTVIAEFRNVGAPISLQGLEAILVESSDQSSDKPILRWMSY